jgi:hypothetical protein
LDGGLGMKIIIKQYLKPRLGLLLKSRFTPYNLQMVDQTTTKPIGLIRDMKMYVHGILMM